MKYSDNPSVMKRFVENDRIYNFLVWLNMEFDLVRVQILRKGELFSSNKTIALIRVEDGKHEVMIETPITNNST